jgi:hypothetical protein
MQMIKGMATQQMMNQLGGALGLESKKTSSVFDTCAAALLGGILNKAQTTEGARAVHDLAKNTDFSVLDKLGDLVGGSGAAVDQYQKMGGGLLDSLLGSGKSGMFSILTKALGINSNMIGKLMAMIAPIVMGVISKQLKSQALDASGLANLLGSQKKSLAGFLPGNLAGDLGFKTLLGDVGKVASGAANTASNTARQVANAGEQAGSGLMKILIPLLLIGVLGWVLWKFVLGGGAGDVINKTNNAVQNGVGAAKDAAEKVAGTAVDAVTDSLPKFDDFDVSALGETGNLLKTGFTDITKGLSELQAAGVSEDVAKKLVETISGMTGKIDGMGLDKLEGAGKTASSGLISAFLGSLDGLMAKIPAPLRAIVEPAVKSMIEKLNPFK